MKKKVSALNVGDVLVGSGAKILSAPVNAYQRYSPDAVYLEVRYPNGKIKATLWNKNTVVTTEK